MKKLSHSTRRYVYPAGISSFVFFVALLVGVLFSLPAQAQNVPFNVQETSPERSINWLHKQVEKVIESGSITEESNAARHLFHYLDRAKGTYLKGMPDHSARHLELFIAKVERLERAHRVEERICVRLIDTSETVILQLRADHAEANEAAPNVIGPKSALQAVSETGVTEFSNSPNPFNPTTTIRFTLTESAETHLAVYDMAGREVRQLVNQYVTEGTHEVSFDANGLPSGTYLYKLTTPKTQAVRKMVLLK